MFDEQINCINQQYNQRKDDHQVSVHIYPIHFATYRER
jgi:hypothetical protein